MRYTPPMRHEDASRGPLLRSLSFPNPLNPTMLQNHPIPNRTIHLNRRVQRNVVLHLTTEGDSGQFHRPRHGELVLPEIETENFHAFQIPMRHISPDSEETLTRIPTDVATLNIAAREHRSHATRFRPHDQVAVLGEAKLLKSLLQILDGGVSAGRIGEVHHFSSPFLSSKTILL